MDAVEGDTMTTNGKPPMIGSEYLPFLLDGPSFVQAITKEGIQKELADVLAYVMTSCCIPAEKGWDALDVLDCLASCGLMLAPMVVREAWDDEGLSVVQRAYFAELRGLSGEDAW